MRDGLALAALAAAAVSVLASVTCVSCVGRAGLRTEGREPVACPRDAVAVGGGCQCAPGLVVLEGACVGPRELDAYCGSLGRSSGGAGSCVAPTCAAGEPIDLATAQCAPARAARTIFARVRPVPDDMQIGCRAGWALVVHGEGDDRAMACLPSPDACPRASTWAPGAARCVQAPACPPGEVRREPTGRADDGGPELGRCVRIVTRGGAEEGPIVDVGIWSRAMLGADGGEGTARLCRLLAERPWELDVHPGGAQTVELTLELRFPDNDVTQVSGRVETLDAASQLPVFGAAAQEAQKALDALLVPLRALGGATDAASASTQVRCLVRGGGTPFLLPRPAP